MTLRTRLALFVALVAIALAGTSFGVQRTVLYERFLDLERQLAQDDLERCRDTVAREREHLAVMTADWASWDDTYRFVQDGNDAYAAANLSADVLENLRWHALWFVAEDGRVVRHWARDFATGEALSFPELPAATFPADHPLLPRQALTQTVTGIVRTAAGPLLVASRPIITSQRTGPAKGWLITGRLLTPSMLDTLSRETRVRFHVDDVAGPAVDAAAREALAQIRSTGETVFQDADEDELHAYGLLPDLGGSPAYLLCAHVPRGISQQGIQTIRAASVFMLIACAAIVMLLFVLLRITVATPLRRLTEHAERIGRSGDLTSRSGIVRDDEIGKLAGAFDDMVGKLADSRAQLTDAARRVGMAEVARDVLHNVGNVLTGVSVSAGNVGETLRRSRADGLLRGVDLLAQNREKLGEFLERDERGRVLPDYLVRSAAALRDERAALIAETDRLRRNVEHAVEIVKRQDAFASAPPESLVESVSLHAAVASVAALVEPSYVRDGIVLERRVGADAAIDVDRTKLTQILVNLLTNARDAMAGRDAGERRVVLTAEAAGGTVRISVADTGCGMTEETLARAFASGFSTKGGGRGVGLHYCALAARGMGGSLHAASDGPGRGAIFTLELPQRAGARAAGPDGPVVAPGPEADARAPGLQLCTTRSGS